MKKYFAIEYIARRLALIASVVCLLFTLLKYEDRSKHDLYLILTIVFAATFIALTVAQRILKERGLKKGLSPETFTPKISKSVMLYFTLIVMTFIIVLPFYIMFVTSIKSYREASLTVFSWWPKNGVKFDAYASAFTDTSMGITIMGSFANTLYVTVIPTFVSVFISALSAYSFSRLEFRGKEMLFGILLLTMMVPGCVTMTSSYLIYAMMGWTNSFKPLIIPALFGGASIVFFLREYFAGIPEDLFGSAKIDGLGKMGCFFYIVIPLSAPAIIAQIVLTFVGRYNDYMGPLIYLRDPRLYTMPILLRSFVEGTSGGNKALNAAGCVISVAPLLIIYLFLQNQILSGIAMSSGLK